MSTDFISLAPGDIWQCLKTPVNPECPLPGALFASAILAHAQQVMPRLPTQEPTDSSSEWKLTWSLTYFLGHFPCGTGPSELSGTFNVLLQVMGEGLLQTGLKRKVGILQPILWALRDCKKEQGQRELIKCFSKEGNIYLNMGDRLHFKPTAKLYFDNTFSIPDVEYNQR